LDSDVLRGPGNEHPSLFNGFLQQLESELTRTREALGTITEERTKLAAQGDAHRLLLADYRGNLSWGSAAPRTEASHSACQG
jgi:hypothetical protein